MPGSALVRLRCSDSELACACCLELLSAFHFSMRNFARSSAACCADWSICASMGWRLAEEFCGVMPLAGRDCIGCMLCPYAAVEKDARHTAVSNELMTNVLVSCGMRGKAISILL